MKDTLRKLFELQQLDDALRDTREAREALSVLREENVESLEVFAEMLEARSAHIEETRAFISEKNREIQETEEALKRSRSRMAAITSQRELTALNKELETNRRLNTQRREEMAKLKLQLAEADEDHAKKQRERDDIKNQMDALEAELADALARKDGNAEHFAEQRVALRKELPLPLVGRYDRISKARHGNAISDCSDGRCRGCNIKLYPQVFIRVQRLESLESCAHCSRILIYGNAFTSPVVE